MKVADYIINYLASVGIDTVFLVYGSAIGDLVDAFTRTEGIRHICPIHEQGGGYMAEGWSKVTGKTGCAMATSGVTPIPPALGSGFVMAVRW